MLAEGARSCTVNSTWLVPLLPSRVETSSMTSDGNSTVVRVTTTLLAGTGSISPRATSVWLVNVPTTSGVPTMITLATVPAPTVPKSHLTTLPSSAHVPIELVTDTNPKLAGRRLVRVTDVASVGPRLVTVMV